MSTNDLTPSEARELAAAHQQKVEEDAASVVTDQHLALQEIAEAFALFATAIRDGRKLEGEDGPALRNGLEQLRDALSVFIAEYDARVAGGSDG